MRVLIAAVVTLGCSGSQRPRVAGAYRFQCDPPEARVFVDEDDMGPCAVWSARWMGFGAGTHRVRVAREGWFPYESEVTPNGARVTVPVRLRRVPE